MYPSFCEIRPFVEWDFHIHLSNPWPRTSAKFWLKSNIQGIIWQRDIPVPLHLVPRHVIVVNRPNEVPCPSAAPFWVWGFRIVVYVVLIQDMLVLPMLANDFSTYWLGRTLYSKPRLRTSGGGRRGRGSHITKLNYSGH